MSMPRTNLRINDFVYSACRRWVQSVVEPVPQLKAVSSTASLAWMHHPGRFSDGILENCALRRGLERALPPTTNPAKFHWDNPRPSTTLHVASEVYNVGGHTRVLAKWVMRDGSANHLVVLTNQQSDVPTFLEAAVGQARGTIIRLPPSDSPIIRAAALRSFSMRCDRVVLHSHPHDPVPNIAFAQPGGPPIAMFNHAHFGFSLGPSVSDLIVNTFDYFRQLSKQFRYARRTFLLPVVSGIAPWTKDPIDKAAAKARISEDASSCIVLTVGQEHYFRPAPGYDFFRTARRLLKEHPRMLLLLMGVPQTSRLIPHDLRDEPRCRFLGPIVDPVPYYRAADVFLESFPMPSLGAVAEAVAQGEAFAIPVYGPTEGILRVSQEPLLSYPYRPRDEDDYVRYVGQVISRLGDSRDQARQHRRSLHTIEEGWGLRLRELNHAVDELQHIPHELPRTSMIDSQDCQALADLYPLDNIADSIDAMLPFSRAIRSHLAAACHGYMTPREALRRVRRQIREDLAGPL